jgi:hypothetical protein
VTDANPARGSVVPSPSTLSHTSNFPEPRPPCTPLYRAGASSGSKTFAVGILRMDNDALDAVDELEGAVIAVLQGLCGLAPAAIEDGVRSRYARRRGGILAAHDADQDIDRGPAVASRQRADLGDSLRHLSLTRVWRDVLARRRIGMIQGGIIGPNGRAESDGRKIGLRVTMFRAWDEVDYFCAHEKPFPSCDRDQWCR